VSGSGCRGDDWGHQKANAQPVATQMVCACVCQHTEVYIVCRMQAYVHGMNIYRYGVNISGSKSQRSRFIPSCGHVVCVRRQGACFSGETKVRDFDAFGTVTEQVLGFQIAVKIS